MHVYAFVGVGEEDSTDKESISLQQHNEARSFVAQADDSDPDWRKTFRLQPGERRGWWSFHPKSAKEAGIALVGGAVCDHRTVILLDTGSDTSIHSLELARRLGL
jgi:hypothetical protein